jgi:hypothetical protein
MAIMCYGMVTCAIMCYDGHASDCVCPQAVANSREELKSYYAIDYDFTDRRPIQPASASWRLGVWLKSCFKVRSLRQP